MSKLQSTFTRVGPHLIHARRGGQEFDGRPTIVLVHGLVVSSLYMVPTAEILAGSFRVYSPDLPGFGKSSKPSHVLDIGELADVLLQWMDVMKLDQPVLVGNSLGCQIIADLIARHPHRARSIVLAGPTMDPHARNAWVQIGRWLADWKVEKPSLALTHVRDFFEAGPRRALCTFRFALADPVEEKLRHINVPALVVRGSRDPIATQRWCEEVAAGLPRGRLQVIAGGPHVVNYTTAEPFVRLIQDFVNDDRTD